MAGGDEDLQAALGRLILEGLDALPGFALDDEGDTIAGLTADDVPGSLTPRPALAAGAAPDSR